MEKTSKFIGPYTRGRIPYDSPLQIAFPRRIEEPEAKVIYALWREGDQPFCNLHLLTNFSRSELKRAINKLTAENRLRKNSALGPELLGEEMATFSLIK